MSKNSSNYAQEKRQILLYVNYPSIDWLKKNFAYKVSFLKEKWGGIIP